LIDDQDNQSIVFLTRLQPHPIGYFKVTKTLKTTFEDSGAQLDTYVLYAFKWLHKFDKITRSTGNGQIQSSGKVGLIF